MDIEYKSFKNLPCDKLYKLFLSVGWAEESSTTQEMIDYFNIGFVNSTFVFSAWVEEELVGCVRVLSDFHFRSVVYDLAVLPEYQHLGIGTELLKKCREACNGSEILVQTDKAKSFYEKNGFKITDDNFLIFRGKWF